MDLAHELEILPDVAKYDASCASSGAPRRSSLAKNGFGATAGVGICHSHTPDGRCVSLRKILLTNFCSTMASIASTGAAAPDLLSGAAASHDGHESRRPAAALRISSHLLRLWQTASGFSAADRWIFPCKIVWRWQNNDRAVLSVADEDGRRMTCCNASARTLPTAWAAQAG